MIGEIDGEYRHDSRRNILEWCLPVIDAKNKSGSLEFSIVGQPNDFFPVHVSFFSKKNYCNIQASLGEEDHELCCTWCPYTGGGIPLAVLSLLWLLPGFPVCAQQGPLWWSDRLAFSGTGQSLAVLGGHGQAGREHQPFLPVSLPVLRSELLSILTLGRVLFLSLQVTKVTQVDGNSPVRFSTETTFLVDKYEIL